MNRRAIVACGLLLLLTSPLAARVISYSPYTDQNAFPLHQHRMNRHFVLFESPSSGSPWWGGPMITPPMPYLPAGNVVVYDFLGQEEPRVVFPPEGKQLTALGAGAVRENGNGVASILLMPVLNNAGDGLWFSNDTGTTWKKIDVLTENLWSLPSGPDTGGPFAANRYAPIRTGTDAHPFVLAIASRVYRIASDGSAAILLERAAPARIYVAGRNAAGTEFLISIDGRPHVIDLAGNLRTLNVNVLPGSAFEGWITPEGAAYLTETTNTGRTNLWYVKNDPGVTIVSAQGPGQSFFAVPTFDYSGAWILERGPGKPTILSRDTGGTGAVKQWEDITAPEVEALHTGSSGNRLLIQVHRPRPQPDQRIFQDPALAIWNTGEPAPRVYDELFMNEEWNKGFIHLDVEKVAQGEAFVFDSGVRGNAAELLPPGLSPAAPGGGGDVVQEWGVVRASLKQRLVIPSVGRTPGAYGSSWATDVIIQNPLETTQSLNVRYVPNGDGVAATAAQTKVITLARREIRQIEDVLLSLFGIEQGTGALFLEPESGVAATSRTYSHSDAGTFGFGMNAIDVFAAAASARFPVTFSGAFLGSNYRTNIIVTDASERGTEAHLFAATGSGIQASDVKFHAPAAGQQQINSIGPMLGLMPDRTGALIVRPTRGHTVASVFTMDNRTNDPTYFPPDLPSPVVRTIPVIGHIDGANGSRFRSDLYLFNPSSQPKQVLLQVKAWDSPTQTQLTLTLLPQEARVIEDVLTRVFGMTGLARLRYTSMDAAGVRVTSRTYNIDANGGTFGFLMPPLNNFQSGGSGDTLEILGAVADDRYRTNIGLVELTGFANGASVPARIEIIGKDGAELDSFTVNVPVAGGMQLNDIFRARGLSYQGAALIRVTPQSGVIGAYAANVDNRTNDASYLAANLAAKQ